MTTLIFENFEEFEKREDKTANGFSAAFAKLYPNYEKHNETNEGCWNCTFCYYCDDCRYCVDCRLCSNLEHEVGCARNHPTTRCVDDPLGVGIT